MIQFLRQLKCRYALLIFLSILLILRYTSSGIVFAKVKDSEFILNNFLIYNYLYNTIVYLLKIAVVTLLILGGTLLSGYKLKSKQVLKTVILANFVYFFRYIAVITWASFNWSTYNMESLRTFNSKTFLTLKLGDADHILAQFLKSFSLYDIIFVFALLLLTTLLNDIKWKQSTKIIFSSYVPAIIVYALFVVFLTEL
ncbi:hypothetical protein [Marinifilum caeruleilacunae]|uniref:Yip1 domain-containing protein n=1 Tax=Marinifilum caeruleilacunae TaxID=2499076 RepID=A0ABX1WZP2_9BACT|nr:hypothetical protein [Marinifilum caeruleilacunae]NOU61604.1 hypothetical protein [Marinifilum caeruleilacunae]